MLISHVPTPALPILRWQHDIIHRRWAACGMPEVCLAYELQR
jgi:hypothetical protein